MKKYGAVIKVAHPNLDLEMITVEVEASNYISAIEVAEETRGMVFGHLESEVIHVFPL